MARLDSFYLPPQGWGQAGAGQGVELQDAEARHLSQVLRHGPGDTVRLFDGQGREGLFRVESVSRDRAGLTALSVTTLPRPAGLTLALGFNKAARRDWLLEKAVELGATGIVFWQAKRSQGQVPDVPKQSWLDKMAQAAKQCGAVWLPDLAVLPDGASGLARLAPGFSARLLPWEVRDGLPLLGQGDFKEDTILALGPEGGMDQSEAARLSDSGFRAVSLGRSLLRWETAALLCLGLAHMARETAAAGALS